MEARTQVSMPALPAGLVGGGTWTFLQTGVTEQHSNGIADLATQHVQKGQKVSASLDLNGTVALDGGFPPHGIGFYPILDDSRALVGNPILPVGQLYFTFFDTPQHSLGKAKAYDYHDLHVETVDILESKVTRSDSFTTYVMYLPPGDHSRWVPLRRFGWKWGFEAQLDNAMIGSWKLGKFTDPIVTKGPEAWTKPPDGWSRTLQSGQYILD